MRREFGEKRKEGDFSAKRRSGFDFLPIRR